MANTEQRNPDRSRTHEILYEARNAYEARYEYFATRERNLRYRFGEQWSDMMEDPDTGKQMTEEEYIRRQGRVPAQNNQIATIVRNMVGQFRTNYPDPIVFSRTRGKQDTGEVMTATLQAVLDLNETDELDARNLEELVISACSGWKIAYKWLPEFNRKDAWIENIDQTRFFYNLDATDVRMTDINLIGELHDLHMDDILNAFAEGPEDEDRIRDMFPSREALKAHTHHYPDYIEKFKDFYVPKDPDKHRVIEVWRTEHEWMEFIHNPNEAAYSVADDDYFMNAGFSPEETQMFSTSELVDLTNAMRIEQAAEAGVDPASVPILELESSYEPVFHVYYLSPFGDILFESPTPYWHESHPYIFGGYPYLDGRIFSMVGSIIDQQRHINRLISMMDHNIGTAAKNLMWVPKDLIPEGMSPREFAMQSAELNGMVFYKPKQGVPLPKVISTNSNMAGAQDLLALQMNLIKEISAVNDAILGQEPKSGTPSSLYAQQTQNAMITNKDIFDFYFRLIRKRNRRVVQVIQQYYTEERFIRIAGTGFNKGTESVYRPEDVRDVDFDVVLGETQNTLAYRQLMDDYLKDFLDQQYITLEEFLTNSSLPFADKLLQTISNRSQGMGNIDPALMQQMMSGANVPVGDGQTDSPTGGQNQLSLN